MGRSKQEEIQRNNFYESKRSFSDLMENVKLLSIMLGTDGQILFCNSFVLEITGYKLDEIQGKEWFGLFIPKEDREEAWKVFGKTIEGHLPVNQIKNRIITKDGSVLTISWNITLLFDNEHQIIGVASIGESITERTRANKELINQKNRIQDLSGEFQLANAELKVANQQILDLNEVLVNSKNKAEQSERRYKTLYDHTPVMLQSTNMKGEIVSVNGHWLQTMGYKEEEVLGSQTSIYLTSESTEFYKKRLPAFIKEGILNNAEAQAVTKEGEVIDLLISSKILLDNNNEPLLTMTNLVDITEKKKTELQQHKLNEQLLKAIGKAEENNKLKAAFLQNLSHEIRTPMNAICGFSQLLLKLAEGNEKMNRYSSIIMKSSNQLLSIVNNILTISVLETQQEVVNVEMVSVNQIIDEMHTIFSAKIGYRNSVITTKTMLKDKDAIIYTDKTKLTQILTNLISNALRFTPEGCIEFGYTLKGVFLEFYVKDNGIGIQAEKLEIIFERFCQADESIAELYGGSGLGLTISKAFVELLGGEIKVQSELEKGSLFTFTIPYTLTT